MLILNGLDLIAVPASPSAPASMEFTLQDTVADERVAVHRPATDTGLAGVFPGGFRLDARAYSRAGAELDCFPDGAPRAGQSLPARRSAGRRAAGLGSRRAAGRWRRPDRLRAQAERLDAERSRSALAGRLDSDRLSRLPHHRRRQRRRYWRSSRWASGRRSASRPNDGDVVDSEQHARLSGGWRTTRASGRSPRRELTGCSSRSGRRSDAAEHDAGLSERDAGHRSCGPRCSSQATFVTGPIYVWSGMGQITWNGQVWTGIGTLGSISTIEEGSTVAAKGITLTLSGIDASLLEEVMTEFQVGLPVSVTLGVFDANGALIADPVCCFSGPDGPAHHRRHPGRSRQSRSTAKTGSSK